MRPLPPLSDWLKLEHQVAQILQDQEEHGWYFDVKTSRELEETLRTELEENYKLLRGKHPYVFGSTFTPRRDNRTSGYVKGCTFTRIKEFNPTSRDNIAWILKTHYGWEPKLKTVTGKPVIDESVLKEIGTDISTILLRCLTLKKQLGSLSDGKNGWNRLVTSANRIHHHCAVGTATHRCHHRNPNLSQTNSDENFRKLFTASPNYYMVGADLCGVELRLFSSYLARYDGGRYAKILLNGDIHEVNATAVGVSRKEIKRITYCWMYGGSNKRIGWSYDPLLSEENASKKGKEIRHSFVNATPGLDELLQAVQKRASGGSIKTIDGRTLPVESPHKALNFIIQGSSACLAKRWLLITHNTLKEIGIRAHQLAFIHDEIQYECLQKDINDLKFTLENSALKAGEYYNLRIKIEADAKHGKNWSEVH